MVTCGSCEASVSRGTRCSSDTRAASKASKTCKGRGSTEIECFTCIFPSLPLFCTSEKVVLPLCFQSTSSQILSPVAPVKPVAPVYPVVPVAPVSPVEPVNPAVNCRRVITTTPQSIATHDCTTNDVVIRTCCTSESSIASCPSFASESGGSTETRGSCDCKVSRV